MRVSLIITTYNWPEALSLCLKSVEQQTLLPDEVVIADDGSGETTKKVIDLFHDRVNFIAKHAWHEDKGFRAAAIRNRALAECEGEYVVQVDGDLILHRKFIEDHVNSAREGYFLSGGRTMINSLLTQKLLVYQSTSVSFLSFGLSKRINAMYSPFLSRYMEGHKASTYRYGVSANMSFWLADMYRINGYDESFIGWGREDTEVMVRLMNAGIKKCSLHYKAIAFHLHHKSRQDGNILKSNDDILEDSILSKQTYCPNSILKP